MLEFPVAELWRMNAWDKPKGNGVEFNVPASSTVEANWTPLPVLEELPLAAMPEVVGSQK